MSEPRDDIAAENRVAWDAQVEKGNEWTLPLSAEALEQARAGRPQVVLTPNRPVPQEWLGTLAGASVLGLASAGGQQCVAFAAAGAQVTSLDNSPGQLARDREGAEAAGVEIRTELGDMRDLSRFSDASFDLVFCPVSVVFVPKVRPVWKEVARVLKPGGHFLAGLANPLVYAFGLDIPKEGPLELQYPVPYSDLEHLSVEQLERQRAAQEPVVFGHTLEDLIGGQIDAGLVVDGFFEDDVGTDADEAPLARYFKGYFATRARKV